MQSESHKPEVSGHELEGAVPNASGNTFSHVSTSLKAAANSILDLRSPPTKTGVATGVADIAGAAQPDRNNDVNNLTPIVHRPDLERGELQNFQLPTDAARRVDEVSSPL